MLISNQIKGIYGGVNQQSSVNRLSTQVEEMINAIPTLNEELLKRNPTKKIDLSNTISYDNNMFQYNYDRGDIIGQDEKYSIQITSTTLEIIDLQNGNVVSEGNGLTFEGASRDYITTNFGGQTGFSCLTIKDTTFVVNRNIKPKMLDTLSSTTTKKNGFVWIKMADPQYSFTYSFKIKNSSGTFTGSATGNTTTEVATNIASEISNASSSLSTSVSGSVVKVISTSDIQELQITDTYGNEASRGFIDEVETISDLPLVLGFTGTTIKIIGTAGTKTPYYVKYDGNNWKETIAGAVKYLVDKTTLPHILVRNPDGTFTFKQYDKWADRTIGDDEITPIPDFLNGDNVIKDIFFIKNRLGFITSNTVELSEVAKYGNFFRTTALSYLDSDSISVKLNTTQTVNLEYAVNIKDSILLTSNKFQFKLKAVDVLSYSTIEFVPVSAYEINTDVRPIFMNNRVFFVVKRGDYSAVYEFYVMSNNDTVVGNDITAHCQRYIPNTINRLSGSAVNNMLFLSSSGSSDIYVYKYYDNGNERIQSAWFKWVFNGEIFSTFTMNRNLYLLINRYDAQVQTNWILSDGSWNNEKYWDNNGVWNYSFDDIGKIKQVEKLNIFPQAHTQTFLDNDNTIINTDILIGEWVVSSNNNKQSGNIVEFKTVEIESQTGSSFNLYVLDNNRGTKRIVSERYTIGRKPFIGGLSKDIKIGIENFTDKGFRISSIVFEGNIRTRNRRL